MENRIISVSQEFLPQEVANSPKADLSQSEKKVLSVLCKCRTFLPITRGGWFSIGQNELFEMANISQAQGNRVLLSLIAKGLIERIRGTNGNYSQYRLHSAIVDLMRRDSMGIRYPAVVEDTTLVDIDGFEDYQISPSGINERTVWDKRNNEWVKPYRLEKSVVVLLEKDGIYHIRTIHRLLAEAFIPKHEGDDYTVYHKNDNPTDNRLENLIWLKKSEYLKYRQANNTPIQQIDSDGVITDWDNINLAAYNLDLSEVEIKRCCDGERYTYNFCEWRYNPSQFDDKYSAKVFNKEEEQLRLANKIFEEMKAEEQMAIIQKQIVETLQ